jgi:hypothetical protein
MSISEPMTMVTDYILAGISFALALSIVARSRAEGGWQTALWAAAFTVTGIAGLAGGTAHGFRAPLGESWALVWNVTVWSIAVGSILLIAAGVRSAIRPRALSEPNRREGVAWLKRAVMVTLLGVAILLGKVSLHEHFNQNDLYHVVQMTGLYFLYRGALLLSGLAPR